MKMIEATISAGKLEDLTAALVEVGIQGFTTSNVREYGAAKGRSVWYRDTLYSLEYSPKLKMEIVVADTESARVMAMRRRWPPAVESTTTSSSWPVRRSSASGPARSAWPRSDRVRPTEQPEGSSNPAPQGGLSRRDLLQERPILLFDPDCFSGWGIGTVGASVVRYNPMGHHPGAVWTHDNARIALGLSLYGQGD